MKRITNTNRLDNKPKREVTSYDGKKAIIVGDHPYADSVATVQGAEQTIVGWGLVLKDINTGQKFFVFKPENLKWL